MLRADLIREGEHTVTVCNSCRYCEAYCPVFQAMEDRLTFTEGDLTYLANLCHNCGECLYACQYAPPHEFGINVPRVLAKLRLATYEDHCWPQILRGAFKHSGLVASLTFAFAFVVLTLIAKDQSYGRSLSGDFYRVLPHSVMVGIFASVFIFVVSALAIGCLGFWRRINESLQLPLSPAHFFSAAADALTLRHLHDGDGGDCTNAEEYRSPWRRWFHHCTMYGFVFCFASTSVAAVYHIGLRWLAPYPYTSLPVVLGTIGGLGLLVGPAGLLAMKERRDHALMDRAQSGLDTTLIALLFLTSLTGLILLIARESSIMGIILMLHLALVIALFVTMPYGKFVHGILRSVALVKFSTERHRQDTRFADDVRTCAP